MKRGSLTKTAVLSVLAVAIVLAAALGGCFGAAELPASAPNGITAAPPAPALPTAEVHGDDMIKDLFERKKRDVLVSGEGIVVRLLDDDVSGDRHQRFILELESGQTLLVAHNIDIAPRLDGLAPGDTVVFCGEYIWTEKGGTVHWTHRDPDGSSSGGWLEWNGVVYR
ncbi:MAG: DUF3465 domain-containing protein [Oscillospiraceae bacterium]|jgi:hypothetical protein|nr:DUF3465 domain-containing protein [Oscillospiraceae bacterium]